MLNKTSFSTCLLEALCFYVCFSAICLELSPWQNVIFKTEIWFVLVCWLLSSGVNAKPYYAINSHVISLLPNSICYFLQYLKDSHFKDSAFGHPLGCCFLLYHGWLYLNFYIWTNNLQIPPWFFNSVIILIMFCFCFLPHLV